MPAPDQILALVDRFDDHYDSYRSAAYNETQLRREFVDPFFKALGWDVDNEQGYAEAYKDVVHEDSIKVGASTKAPDYSFRVGGVRKYFVETKRPAVNIAHDVSPAFQLRRYAWSAKLPLSILTDFEELAAYDCRVRPQKNDSPSMARTLYLRYDQYGDRWDDIAGIFSREAILKGSFDKYAESTKKKRGTADVDDAFLSDIEQWRSDLAHNLALRNPELSQRELNFAVQKTIDRIIFLRICEDRGIETYGRLQALPNGPKIYARLCELFRHADDRYNSGLFHFTREKERTEQPDEWTLSLNVDDRVLKEIIRSKWKTPGNGSFLVCSRESIDLSRYPSVRRHLQAHEKKLRARYEVRRGDYEWWVVRQVAHTEIFDNPKIVYPDLCSRPKFALNADGAYPNNTVFCVASQNMALLCFLNSCLVWYWITRKCPANRGGAYRLFNQYMNRLPLRRDILENDDLRLAGQQMVSLHEQKAVTKTTHQQTALQRQIDATDRQIDRLLYELYGLTDEEIRIVEEATLP